ncbi:MAG TPA: histidine phosphatase family protein [Roseiarcus sp.]|nr:histidine phosphatase family protein [Roseiarcus sp.]
MSAHLFLIAHAPTAGMRVAAFPRDDEPLEPQAAARLEALRGKLRHADRYLVSPAARARETALGLGLSANVVPALADCDYGRWRGQPLGEIEQREPAGVAAWLEVPEAAPHGGESLAALIARVGAWLDDEAGVRGVTLAITHAAVVRAAIVAAIGAPASAFWRLDVAPLSQTRLSGHDGRWRLAGLGPLAAEG